MAGKFTPIGEEILKLGSSKAKQLATGNWKFINYREDGSIIKPKRDIFKPEFGKVTQYNPQNIIEKQTSKTVIDNAKMIDKLNRAIKNHQMTEL